MRYFAVYMSFFIWGLRTKLEQRIMVELTAYLTSYLGATFLLKIPVITIVDLNPSEKGEIWVHRFESDMSRMPRVLSIHRDQAYGLDQLDTVI